MNFRLKIPSYLIIISMFLNPVLAQQNVPRKESRKTESEKSSFQDQANQNKNLQQDYYGNRSFKLTDDRPYKRLLREQEILQTEVARLEAKVQPLQTELETLEENKRNLEREITGLNSQTEKDASSLKILKKQFEKKEEECKATPSPRCQRELAQLTRTITALENNIKKNKSLIEQKNKERNVVISQIAAKEDQLEPLLNELNTAKNNLEVKTAEVQNRYDILISRIGKFNGWGFRDGRVDGRKEGRNLAKERGEEFGSRDGYARGRQDGQKAGKERAYDEGLKRGETAGTADAQQKGQTDGQTEGRKQGNIDAARIDGTEEGKREANLSDAALIGKTEGEKAGLERAISIGQKEGTRKGENQAIENYESATLENIELKPEPVARAFRYVRISNSFADQTIAGDVPPFPTDFEKGIFYKPDPPEASNVLFTKAYYDGYRFGYDRATRNLYKNNIGEIYDREYERSKNEAYSEFYDKGYLQDEESGYNTGYRQSYDDVYPETYNSYFESSREEFAANPDKTSAEYRETFEKSRKQSYEATYGEIRDENYRIAERETFNANIERQREIYRAKRFAEVSAVYENNPVLKFVSSEISDEGIDQVAGNDGVFQPGEAFRQNFTLINYGKTPAAGIRIKLNTGESFLIDSLPPTSRTTISNYVEGQISTDAGIGLIFEQVATITASLNSGKSIQGRHFADARQGILTRHRKPIEVQYPFSLSDLKTAGQLLVGQENKMAVSIRNNAKRDYNGPIKIELSDGSGSNFILKSWNPVSKIATDQTQFLTDAEVLVAGKKNAYVPVNFKATLSKNGVILGQTDAGFTTKAKLPYKEESADIPVILADSDRFSRDLQAIAKRLGGFDQIAILDTSLNEINRETLTNGLVNKSILILGDDHTGIEQTLKNSSRSALVFVDPKGNGLEKIKDLPMFTGAASFPVKLTEFGNINVLFTNPLLARENKDVQTVLGADLENFEKYLKLADLFKLSADAHLLKIKTSFNKDNYFTPTADQRRLAETYNVKMMGEILNIDLAFRASGKKDKSIVNLLKKEDLFHNKLLQDASIPVDENSLGIHLYAVNAVYTLDKALNKYRPYKTDFSNRAKSRVKDVRRDLEEKFKKDLRKKFRLLYDRVYEYENESLFTPFVVPN